MVTQLTSTTFSATYNDDYEDSDHYHRILFNPGKSVQARELTQLQTIIQKEIERLGNHMFKNGAILNSAGSSVSVGRRKIDAVLLQAAATNVSVGDTIENSLGVKARVKKILTSAQATSIIAYRTTGSPTPTATLLVEYVDGGGQAAGATPVRFGTGQALTNSDGGAAVGTTSATVVNTTGSFIEVPQLNIYVNGLFVMADAQDLVLDPYRSNVNMTVGYKVYEEIVSVTDDAALYDNSGPELNTSSPGADRYRIRLVLTRNVDVSESDTFIPIFEIKDKPDRPVVAETPKNYVEKLDLYKILAERTRDISGNFIANGKSTLALELSADSADDGYYNVSVSPGVAFINGYRVEKKKYSTLRIAKPRGDLSSGDVVTYDTENLEFSYGNYFLVDSIGNNLLDYNISNTTNPTFKLWDSAGADIGNAAHMFATKSFNGSNFDYKIHVSYLDLRNSDGSGFLRSIDDVRKIGGTTASAASTVLPVEGSYNLQDRGNRSLIVPLTKARPKEVFETNSTITYSNIETITAGASGIAVTFPVGGATQADVSDWIIIDAAAGQTVEGFSVNGSNVISGGTPTITNGQQYHVQYYFDTTLDVGGRAFTKNTTGFAASLDANNRFTVPGEVLAINSLIDSDNDEDIRYKFRVLKDITDTYIGDTIYELKGGETAPTGNIRYDLAVLAHGADEYDPFTVTTYDTALGYSNIPAYRSKLGETIPLENVIDFRYSKDADSDYGYATKFPKPGSLIKLKNTQYYQPRVDRIYMTKSGFIKVLVGNSKDPNTLRALPSGTLHLGDIHVNPYMKSKNDARLVRPAHKGYKMRDMRELEERISNLEEITTLTLGELDIKDLSVRDADGLDRYKLGLTVDKFDYNVKTDLGNPENRVQISKSTNAVHPAMYEEEVRLYFDSDLNFTEGKKVVRKGGVLLPEYTQDSELSSHVASSEINLNAFSVARSIGSGIIEPAVDYWERSAVLTEEEGDAEQERIIDQGSQYEECHPFWWRLGYTSYWDFLKNRKNHHFIPRRDYKD